MNTLSINDGGGVVVLRFICIQFKTELKIN